MRIAFIQTYPDEKSESAVTFLQEATRYFAGPANGNAERFIQSALRE